MRCFGLVCAGVLASSWGSLAAAGPAAWCKGTTYDDQSDHSEYLSSNDPMQVLVALAKTACSTNPAVEAQRAQIDQARAAWGKKFGLVDADWLDMAAYDDAHHPRAWDAHLSTKDIAAYTPIDQFLAIGRGFVEQSAGGGIADSYYAADALDAHLTQTGRMGFIVSECFSDDLDQSGHSWAATWAICQPDLDAFDPQKVYDEVRGDTAHDGPTRMAIRLLAHDLPAKITALRAKEDALFKEDAEYKRVFDVAAKARDAWQKTFASQGELLDLAFAMDAAVVSHSRKALAGCEARTTAELEKAVAMIPAKAFAGMHDVRNDPFHGFGFKASTVFVNNPLVYVAGTAFAECQPTTGYASYLGAALTGMPGFRGPRTAAQHALMSEPFTFDDTSKPKLPVPKAGERPFTKVLSAANFSTFSGVVKALKPKGDKVLVELKSTPIRQQDCVKEHPGHRIERIESDGTIDYEIICDKWSTVVHNDSWDDFTTSKASAKRLRPGVMFSGLYGTDDSDFIAIWSSPSAKLPSMVLGARVK